QAVFLGFCSPGDGRLWSLHVPTSIRRISVNPSMCRPNIDQDVRLPFHSVLNDSTSSEISGNVDIYTEDGQHTILQVEGIRAMPLAPATPADDFIIFSEILWNTAVPDGELIAKNDWAAAEEIEMGYLLERVAYYYLRTLDKAISEEER